MAKEVIHIPSKKVAEVESQEIVKLRVAAYCRVSSEEDKQLNS